MGSALLALLLMTSADDPGKAAFKAIHDETLRRAQVWQEPATPIEEAKLGRNPDDEFPADATVECTFKPGPISGTTPKFDCDLGNGDRVKVKYGRANPEVYTEVAATRLLAALGFPADRMYIVRRVVCTGCPPDPFARLECANDAITAGRTMDECFADLDFTRAESFDDVVIERPVK